MAHSLKWFWIWLTGVKGDPVSHRRICQAAERHSIIFVDELTDIVQRVGIQRFCSLLQMYPAIKI